MTTHDYSGATGPELEAALGLDELVSETLAHWPLTGGTILVRHRDTTLIERDFGVARRAVPNADSGDSLRQGSLRQDPPRQDPLYQIGSISKAFTGSVISQLVDEGELSLDDKVTDVLPWFVAPAGSESATVRQLLHHTAGWISGSDAVPGEMAQAIAMATTSVATVPGETFHYSNAGYIVLGLIVERVTGTSLADAVRSRILEPLGMSDSLSAILNRDRDRFIGGTVPANDELPWLPGDGLAPAQWLEATGADGNVAATARDLGRFAAALVSLGDDDSSTPRLFPGTMLSDLASSGEPILEIGAHEPVLASNYGYGLNVERVARGLLVSHGGGMVGYASFLLADLEAGISVVVLTNAQGDQPLAELLARDLHAGVIDAVGSGESDGDSWRASQHRGRRIDPRTWDESEVGTGRFRSVTDPHRELTVEQLPNGRRTVSLDGHTAELFWTLSGRATTTHPVLRGYHLRFVVGTDKGSGGSGAGWDCGPHAFRVDAGRVGAGRVDADGADASRSTAGESPYRGRYRSYSPWFPYFEVLERAGTLVLCAPGGVEAPDDDVELVELSPGRFRVGADRSIPERVEFGPVVDGVAVAAHRDGCAYARQTAHHPPTQATQATQATPTIPSETSTTAL